MSAAATISKSWEPDFTQKHNRLIAIILGLLPALAPWISSMGLLPQLVILAGFVVLIGLPHGALDITLLRGARIGPLGTATALIAYTILAALVVAGFSHFPTAGLFLFLVVAWIHFGLGDTENLRGWHRAGECFARGGLSIAGPLTFHFEETLDLFTRLGGPASGVRWAALGHYFTLFASPVWLGMGLLMVALRLRAAGSVSGSSASRMTHFLAAWEMIFLALLFWLWPPLAAFTIYFCLVHSVRHLIQLASARQPLAFRLAIRWLWRESWPITGLTLILGAVVVWFWDGSSSPDTLLLRLVFVGLAALTMPHMILTFWWHHCGEPVPGDFCARSKTAAAAPPSR